ncbi:MAG: hypothetical protein JNL11_07270 [Bdellovibrionaceae bacterium]|nr:hypothetical protein [Pseudobdellovibrionaceae bacterium]
MKTIFLILCTTLLYGCTQTFDTPLPDKRKYETDGALMVNVCKKFSEEPDAKKLHKAAVAVQAARVISCSNYNNECDIYGRCLSEVINASKDGDVSSSERAAMKKTAMDLKVAVDEGNSKIETELNKRSSQ